MKTHIPLTPEPARQASPAAVVPAVSTVIHTESDAIQSGSITIMTQGQKMPAYYARPKIPQKKRPVILVVQEIFGVHAHIEDICRRLAQEGYLAIAPELYFRQGNPDNYTEISTLLKELVSKVPDEQVLADLDHVAHWAREHGGDKDKIGITGFCWGGRITWLYAAHNPQVKAGVAWYGKLTGDKTLTQQKHPLDVTADLNAPVLGLYGAKDESIALNTVETMQRTLHNTHPESEIVIYPQAGHAFYADYRPNYHAESAKDGWQRMINWFATQGVTP
ncbi:dienelactone hydrolase family protein [Enterobacteriaceae bacterium LUAb1]